jgi:SAM-dependent methyltransferase
MRQQERVLISKWIASPIDLVLAAIARTYPLGRAVARTLGIQLSRHPRLSVLVNAIRDPWARIESFDCDYAAMLDYWGYTTEPYERERHSLAIKLLDFARNGKRFGRVLEIACAEGVFTEMLAPLCDSLLAVDFSEIALERARRRLAQANGVSFNLWNLRTDPIPGVFDLIVVMDVLTCIRRPGKLRKVIDKLVGALRSGDLLLAGDYRESPELRTLEESRLGQHLLFGGKWVIQAIAAHQALQTLRTASTDSHVFALLRKV